VDDPEICHRADFCATLNLWKKLKKSMRDVLEGVTLEDLANEQKEIIEQKTKGQMYYI
jgi:DNA-binding IscR family transcriptional regulator